MTDIGTQTSYRTLPCVDRQPKRANQRCQVDARQKGGSKVKAAAVAASNAAKVNATRRSDLMPILFRRNVVTFGLLCVMHFTFCAVLFCSRSYLFCSILFAIVSVLLILFRSVHDLFYSRSVLSAICSIHNLFCSRSVLFSISSIHVALFPH